MQSPSFNRYSSGTFEDIAARVIAEFPDYLDDDVYILETLPPNKSDEEQKTQETDDDDNEEEFEFPSLLNSHVASIPADQMTFPIFGRDSIGKPAVRNSNPLWKLMREEREAPASCSSSEGDDLDGVPEGTYCAWSPAAAEARCRKSHSAGSSKRWKIRDLVKRSNSEGKGGFVIFSPTKKVVAGGGGDVQRSPYKVDLAGGIFANVKHFRRSFPPV